MSAPAQPTPKGNPPRRQHHHKHHQPYRRTSAIIDERPDGTPIIFGYGRHMTKREKERVQRLIAYVSVGVVAVVSVIIIAVSAVYENIILPNQSVATVSINGQSHEISRHDRDIVAQYYTAQAAQAAQSGTQTQSDPQALALTKLEQDLLTRRAAKDTLNVAVTDSDVKAHFASDLPNFGGDAGFNRILSVTGLSKDQYLQYFTTPLALNQKIGNVLTANNPTIAEQWHYARLQAKDKKTADQVLVQLVRGHTTFAKMVAQYSLDAASKALGGDPGWVRPTDARIDPLAGSFVSTLKSMQKTSTIYTVIQNGSQWYVLNYLGHDLKHPLTPTQIQYDKEDAYGLWFQKQKDKAVFNPPLANPASALGQPATGAAVTVPNSGAVAPNTGGVIVQQPQTLNKPKK